MAYCLRCKKMQPMKGISVKRRDGRVFIMGSCTKCKTKMMKMVSPSVDYKNLMRTFAPGADADKDGIPNMYDQKPLTKSGRAGLEEFARMHVGPRGEVREMHAPRMKPSTISILDRDDVPFKAVSVKMHPALFSDQDTMVRRETRILTTPEGRTYAGSKLKTFPRRPWAITKETINERDLK